MKSTTWKPEVVDEGLDGDEEEVEMLSRVNRGKARHRRRAFVCDQSTRVSRRVGARPPLTGCTGRYIVSVIVVSEETLPKVCTPRLPFDQ